MVPEERFTYIASFNFSNGNHVIEHAKLSNDPNVEMQEIDLKMDNAGRYVGLYKISSKERPDTIMGFDLDDDFKSKKKGVKDDLVG